MTVELRGESDVYDDYAAKDAKAIFRFLQRRGFISPDASARVDITAVGDDNSNGNHPICDSDDDKTLPPLPSLKRDASPLTGVDMVEAEKAGLVAWRVKPGQVVQSGQILGEIVDCEDPGAPRVPVKARTSGVIFSMARHKLVRPGVIIVKVAGSEPLPWRTGNLLTSR